MQSLAVVKVNDVVSNIGHGFAVVGIVFLPDSLHLEVQEESLHDGVDAPMSSRRCRVFQVGQDKWVKLTNDVAL